MPDRAILVEMTKTLLRDIQEIQQRGAGYYTTAPFVDRYNALAAKTRAIFADTNSQMLETFTPVEDTTSVDPMDKMKITQRVIVELGQLVAFMESVFRETAAPVADDGTPAPADAAASEEPSC